MGEGLMMKGCVCISTAARAGQDLNYSCIASCPANMYRLTPPTIESDSMLARAPPLDEADAPPPVAAAEPLPLAAENGLVSGGSAGLDWTVIILKFLKISH